MDLIRATRSEAPGLAVEVRGQEIRFNLDSGDDRAWQPVEGLVASLASCLGLAIARYCETLGLSDETLALYLTYQMADHPPRISTIVIDVELPDGFPADRKPALERLLRLCPVHSTLMNPPEIDVDFG